MTFRTRLTLLSGFAVAFSVTVSAIALYFVVSADLMSQVDQGLRNRVTAIAPVMAATTADGAFRGAPAAGGCVNPSPTPSPNALPQAPLPACLPSGQIKLPTPALGGPAGYVQLFDASGKITLLPDEHVKLPLTAQDLSVARNGGPDRLEDAVVTGVHVRIVTHALGGRQAFLLVQGLDDIDAVLGNLRLILLALCIIGIAVAAGLGRVVARTTIRPVDRLTLATEHIAGTRDLSKRIAEPGSDEVGRLARSFNRMLNALEASQRTQRHLVADASHELRTPLSSLRTNVELLARDETMGAEDRSQMLAAVLGQIERLGKLVADLLDLARGDEPSDQTVGEVQLDEIVAVQVDYARHSFPGVEFDLKSEPTSVNGDADRIGRAIANLLDNAGKWSPSPGVVEIRVSATQVSVTDHGPGIDAQDLPFVFERFWRAPDARQKPGSGLGLAIVQQVATSHGGSVVADATRGGGCTFLLTLPALNSAS